MSRNWENLSEQERKFPQPKNIYIVKPGEVTNRGHGITVVNDIQQIKYILQSKEVHKNGNPKTYIM